MKTQLRDDAGLTLIEVLMAVVIMSIAFSVILGGMFTAIVVSDQHRKSATADSVIRSMAEWVKSAPYVACPSSSNYASGFSAPAGFSITVSGVQYWDQTTSAFVPVCPGVDAGAQRVSLVASSSDGRGGLSLQLVKRQP